MGWGNKAMFEGSREGRPKKGFCSSHCSSECSVEEFRIIQEDEVVSAVCAVAILGDAHRGSLSPRKDDEETKQRSTENFTLSKMNNIYCSKDRGVTSCIINL